MSGTYDVITLGKRINAFTVEQQRRLFRDTVQAGLMMVEYPIRQNYTLDLSAVLRTFPEIIALVDPEEIINFTAALLLHLVSSVDQNDQLGDRGFGLQELHALEALVSVAEQIDGDNNDSN